MGAGGQGTGGIRMRIRNQVLQKSMVAKTPCGHSFSTMVLANVTEILLRGYCIILKWLCQPPDPDGFSRIL